MLKLEGVVVFKGIEILIKEFFFLAKNQMKLELRESMKQKLDL